MKNAVFADIDGTEKPFYMGCYGIGIGRTLATAVEKFHDDKGIIWPESIAPFKIHLVGLNLEDEATKTKAFEVYNKLNDAGVEVLFDDRVETMAGEKFADADLIGIPWRVVVSKKTLVQGDEIVEVKRRGESESKVMNLSELVSSI